MGGAGGPVQMANLQKALAMSPGHVHPPSYGGREGGGEGGRERERERYVMHDGDP